MVVTTLRNPGEIKTINANCGTSEQGTAAVVALEEHALIFE
jgi:hypothetical protein